MDEWKGLRVEQLGESHGYSVYLDSGRWAAETVVQCTVYSVQCTVYSLQCSVYCGQFSVDSVQCTVEGGHHTMDCIQYTIQSAVSICAGEEVLVCRPLQRDIQS